VPPGLDVNRFLSVKRREKRSEKKIVKIIAVNNLMQRKGIEDILYAVKLLNKKKEFEIHIFGDKNIYTEYVAELIRLLENLGLEKRVYFRGSFFGDELLTELEDADIFLQASHFEGYGISLVEAMLAGLPPVTTNTGIAEELIQDGQNGFLVPIKNPPAIAKALNILLNNEKLRKKMGIKARKTAIRHALTWEEVGNMFESAVDSLLIEK
jgi:glycosyltransferase involved in cell wall biosynthesis